MNFTAIDFETASTEQGSACAIGLVKVENSEITEEVYSLIRPYTPYFDPKCVRVHGITWEDVKREPTFHELWPEIEPLIQHQLLIAHNASFDMKVLRSALQVWGLSGPSASYNCSVQVSRKTWPEFYNHKLSTVAHELSIDLNHHHALDDARAAAAIIIKAQEIHSAFSEEAFLQQLNLSNGTLAPGVHYTPAANRKRKRLALSPSGFLNPSGS
ncbi:3'-5' exonuclease [Alkalicoccus luteus]|uniref:3'-5' exonuclease n=1 Tax=Alkalicoccus luteus TaxID=1237094 RepID=A0A969PNN5_9BACI|nr:3'-5' exonuclease [Alkalicoccus luteus]NJP36613.1 3'-5' exonuclease [Alkalicoccus luteus]